MMKLMQGDCLDLMKELPDRSIDFILCDLPYGTTNAKWDKIIPFEPLWEQYNRIIRKNGAICLFGSEPFSTYLRMSNIKHYKYDWIWVKNCPTGFLHAKNAPLKLHENISVFSLGSVNHETLTKNRMVYYPQMSEGKPYKNFRKRKGGLLIRDEGKNNAFHERKVINNGERYPKSVLRFIKQNRNLFHPTEKPADLLQFLIKTYTVEGETVLDNCMGGGSTGAACLNAKRHFIGMELDANFFEIAKERLERLQEAGMKVDADEQRTSSG